MKTTSSRLSRLARVALPAAPLALAAVPSAHAAIIYTNPADVTFSFADNKYIWVDMGTGGSPGAAAIGEHDRYFTSVPSPSFYLWFRSSGARPEWVSNDGAVSPGRIFDGDNNAVAQAPYGYVGLLAPGTTIDSSLSFVGNYEPFRRTTGAGDTSWTPGTTGYIGVKFDTATSAKFGWVQISYNLDQSLTVHDFAYESSGAGITVVPEPSTYAALAGLLAGSAALYAKRRRQKQAA